MQTEQLLCWSGMTDTDHSTTSSSNEKDENDVTKIFHYKNYKNDVTKTSGSNEVG